VEEGLPGAHSAGSLLEGPFFTEKDKGAQHAEYFLDPTAELFNHWQSLARGQLVKIALAPARERTLEFIDKVIKAGVQVALGHTDASYDCCQEAITRCANTFVHLFNGMSGLHHRNPGVAGSALLNNAAYAELICDG